MSTSSVSRQVVNLEDHFGRQLFVRTTRSLRLTEDGAEMLEACSKIVQDYEAMVQDRARVGKALKGHLSVTMPHFVMSVLAHEFFPDFTRRHPHVRLSLAIDDRVSNLVAEGHDLAVRVGRLPDSALMARKLADLRISLVGSRAYLVQKGAPARPDDLRDHDCIIDTVAPYRNRWPFVVGGKVSKVEVDGQISVNSGPDARDLAINGVGLALLPELLVYTDVAAGRLVTLLEDFVPVAGGVYVVYPRARYPTTLQRELTDSLAGYLRRYAQNLPGRKPAATDEAEAALDG